MLYMPKDIHEAFKYCFKDLNMKDLKL